MQDQLLWFIGGFLFILTFFPFLKKLNEHRQLAKIVNKIPGPRSFPFIGTTYVFFTVPRKGEFFVSFNHYCNFLLNFCLIIFNLFVTIHFYNRFNWSVRIFFCYLTFFTEAFKTLIKIAQSYPGGIFRFWNGSQPDVN